MPCPLRKFTPTTTDKEGITVSYLSSIPPWALLILGMILGAVIIPRVKAMIG